MKRKLHFKLLLSIILVFLSIVSYGQFAQNPPVPRMEGEVNTFQASNCGDIEYDEDGNPISPPPGLPTPCLPINDYIIPFLLAGIIYGVYKTRKIEQA